MKVILNVGDDFQYAFQALRLAERFDREYPDRVGIRQCAIFLISEDGVKNKPTSLIVYRTAAGSIVVRK